MLNKSTEVIKDVEVTTIEFPARKKVSVAAKVLPLLPVLIRNFEAITMTVDNLANAADDQSEEEEKSEKAQEEEFFNALKSIDEFGLSEALSEAISVIDEDKLFSVLDSVLGNTTVNGHNAKEVFSEGYSGPEKCFEEDFTLVFLVAWHAIKTNNFFKMGATGQHPDKKK